MTISAAERRGDGTHYAWCGVTAVNRPIVVKCKCTGGGRNSVQGAAAACRNVGIVMFRHIDARHSDARPLKGMHRHVGRAATQTTAANASGALKRQRGWKRLTGGMAEWRRRRRQRRHSERKNHRSVW